MLTSLDGFFEGPNHEIDWHNVDEEFNEFAIKQLNEIDTLLFGRVTYQLMANYWPTTSAKEDDPIVSELMNKLPKIVFSKTLSTVDWNNTKLVKDNIKEVVTDLKLQSKKDIAIFGSSNLSVTLLELKLIDEIRIIVNPVILGDGKSLFNGIKNKLNFELLKTKVFNSGNILLYYKPKY